MILHESPPVKTVTVNADVENANVDAVSCHDDNCILADWRDDLSDGLLNSD